MTFRGTLVAAVAAGVLAVAPGAQAADPPPRELTASVNDPGIDDSRGKNLIWLAPADKRVGKLLVFLPFGGAANFPTQFMHLGNEMRRLGYHTISLAYKNEVPIANVNACGNDELPLPASPLNCAINARMEILNGVNTSTVIAVDGPNSIENRLNKVLAYLVTNHADEGWAQFVDDNGEPKWSDTVIAGGSLGAGQAALIASLHRVSRVALFGSWTDVKHPEVFPPAPPRPWVKIGATPAEDYFSLIHARDVHYGRTCTAYAIFAMAETCPLVDSAELAENRPLPFRTRQLVFNLPRDPTAPEQPNGSFHPSVIRDNFIPKDTDGVTPSPVLVNLWRSTLGDSDADTYVDPGDGIEHADNCPQLANADQDDADLDGIGDACDATPRGTIPPVITVAGTTVDATGPAGALVGYTATATDDLDGTRPVTCTPGAGSQFAIGTTALVCSASDAGGNTANANFTVTVRGAPEQLARLVLKVGGSPLLAALVGSLDPGRPLQRAVACLKLRAFVTLVPFVVHGPKAAEWIADANRIRAVLRC